MGGQYTRRVLLRLAATTGILPAASGGAAASRSRPRALDADGEYLERELRNYAKTQEAPAEQAADPEFMRRWRIGAGGTASATPSGSPPSRGGAATPTSVRRGASSAPATPPSTATSTSGGSTGPSASAAGWRSTTGRGRLSGYLWTPAEAPARGSGTGLPGVVLTNGSVQAPEPLYWWAAQSLVAAGYVVLTYDPRGQGRSDSVTPDGERGGNASGEVFVSN